MKKRTCLDSQEMKPKPVLISRFILLVGFIICFISCQMSYAAIKRTWTGISGGDWNKAVNWSPSGVPTNGDTLVFGILPLGRTRIMINNITQPRYFRTIIFLDDGYSVRGKAFGITEGILAAQSSGNITILCNLGLGTKINISVYRPSAGLIVEGMIFSGGPFLSSLADWKTVLTVNAGKKSTVTFKGKISGLNSLRKIGAGTLILSGDNDYDGSTIVQGGTLRVKSKTALGNSNGSTYVHIFAVLSISLEDNSIIIEPLTLNGGTLHVVNASLNWDGPIKVQNGIFNCPNDAILRINGLISGTGGFSKKGSGELYLFNSNTYEGITTIYEGTVYLGNINALGNTAQGTTIKGSAALSLGWYSNINNSLDFLGESFAFSGSNSTLYYYGYMKWRGPIIVDPGSTGTICGRRSQSYGSYARFNILGPIEGSGDLTFLADEFTCEVIIEGINTNTLSGITKVFGGQVFLKKPNGVAAIAGPLEIRGYDYGPVASRVSVGADDQLGGPSQTSITMFNGGQLILDGFSITTQQLFMHEGSVHLRQNGKLVLFNGHPAIVAEGGTVDFLCEGGILWAGVLEDGEIEVEGSRGLTIGAKIMNDGEIFSKTGSGTLELIGNTNSATVRVQEGILLANGSRGYKVQISNTGILAGKGIVGTVTGLGGTIAPGAGQRLTVGNLGLSNTKVKVELNGMDAGTNYDQIKVNGGVSLISCVLEVTLGFQPEVGSAFIILDNDGTENVAGTFNGLSESGQLVVPGPTPVTFRISYRGGDGNDIVLTRI